MSDSTVTAALNPTREVRAATASGYLMLFVWLVLLALALWAGIGNGTAEVQVAWKWVLVVVAATLGTLILCGFYLINPNEAAAIQLFGSYKGTDRERSEEHTSELQSLMRS